MTRFPDCLLAAALFACLALPVSAATDKPAPAPEKPATKTNPAPAKAAPDKAAVPPVPEDYFQRYGKILTPGSEPAHPLKLAMPFPDVGQIKVPTQGEIDMREKLERLATLSDEDIRMDLYKWPAFNKMNLADEGAMLMRIQQFKDRRARLAQEKAHALGLLTLKPEQAAQFEKEYWDKRLQLDRVLAKQFGPVLKASEDKIGEDLFREFSTPEKPAPPPAVAQTAKPPAPASPATNPAPMH